MKKTGLELLEEALKEHANAVAAFSATAKNIPEAEWSNTGDAKKWTPAHVTEHLTLVYEVLLQELNGGSGMRVVTNFWEKAIARWLILPRILSSGIFPVKARAPKETRPQSVRANQKPAVAAFEELAQAFQEKVHFAYNRDPNSKLTHAYFGSYPLESAVLLCAKHILHHRKGLVEIPKHK